MLRDAFEVYGHIADATIVMDRETGRSRGFGFITFENPDDACAAIEKLHDTELDNRKLTVAKAQQRSRDGGRERRGGYGGGRGGGRGFRGGGGRGRGRGGGGSDGGGSYGSRCGGGGGG